MEYPMGSTVRLTKGNSVLELKIGYYWNGIEQKISTVGIERYIKYGWKVELVPGSLPTTPGWYSTKKCMDREYPILFQAVFDNFTNNLQWSIFFLSDGTLAKFTESEVRVWAGVKVGQVLRPLSNFITIPED